VSSAFVELDSDDDECELLSVSNVLELLAELEEWLLTLESLLDDSLLSEDELLLLELELFEELVHDENSSDEDDEDEDCHCITIVPGTCEGCKYNLSPRSIFAFGKAKIVFLPNASSVCPSSPK